MTNQFYELTHHDNHCGLPTIGSINNPLRVDILERHISLFNHMGKNSNDLLFFGCEMHFPGNMNQPPVNCLFLHFMQRFTTRLSNTGSGGIYAWSREQRQGSSRFHYSWFVLVHAGVATAMGCRQLAKTLWLGHTLGSGADGANAVLPFADREIRIRRGAPDCQPNFAEAYRLASRLAMNDTKWGPPNVRRFGSSHLS